MSDQSNLWQIVSRVVEAQGLILFDIDMPKNDGGAPLRIYVARPKSATTEESGEEESTATEPPTDQEESSNNERRRGVTFEDCTRVAKSLLDLDEEKPFIPEGCLLEVSSPGINRKLRRKEHFEGAVGERVKIKSRVPIGGGKAVIGKLLSCEKDALVIESEAQKAQVTLQLSDVTEARIDFKF